MADSNKIDIGVNLNADKASGEARKLGKEVENAGRKAKAAAGGFSQATSAVSRFNNAIKAITNISFLTTGEDETRAWTIPMNCKAPKAAGKIHTDFERGFIKAEVINYQQLLDCGSYAAARDKGLVRIEGKEYTQRTLALPPPKHSLLQR